MDATARRTPGVAGRSLLIAGLVALTALLTVAMVGAGVAVAAAIAGTESPQSWSRLADVGQAFGALDSVLSGLAFAALVVTLWIQFRELRLQQTELRQQRDAIERSNAELRRSAEANMRMLHFELIRMSIDEPRLADVWPHPAAIAGSADRRQFIYANLVFQHVSLGMRVAGEPDEAVRRQLRHLFGSPVMREYWRLTAEERAALLPAAGEESRIARIGDEVCAELDHRARDTAR